MSIISKEYLQQFADRVSCNMCGSCCPQDCPHFSNAQCGIHDSQHETSPLFAPCELKPVELVLCFGIFCPPAVEFIENSTGIKISASTANPRYCNQEELERILSVDLRETIAL